MLKIRLHRYIGLHDSITDNINTMATCEQCEKEDTFI